MTLILERPRTLVDVPETKTATNRSHATTLGGFVTQWAIARPTLAVRLRKEGDIHVAYVEEPPMFGEGSTVREATSDLLASLRELRRELLAAPALAPDLRHQLSVLNSLFPDG